jgi:hypothetical protein
MSKKIYALCILKMQKSVDCNYRLVIDNSPTEVYIRTFVPDYFQTIY